MIVTLTINPAIDRIISIDRLAFEDRAYINSSRESAGGRGINVSSVIHSFGGETLAVLISGGDSGKRLEGLLGKCGYRIAVVPVQNEIRTNLTITDKHGLTVNLNEPGPQLGKAEVARVERVVRDTLDRASWLMICGSIPPGVPPAFYGKLVSMARHKKVKTLLHADGDALREGIAAAPRWSRRTSRRPGACWARRCSRARTIWRRPNGFASWERTRWCSRWVAGAPWARPRTA